MSASDNPSDKASQGLFPGTLNVFLHGLIGVLNNENGIELLIPDVGPEHAYRFGEFLGEVTLPPSTAPYDITGIEGGDPAPFPPDAHLCTSHRKPVCAEAPLYARIKLPHPVSVHSYLKVDLTDVIEDPYPHMYRDENGKTWGTLTPVLEYSFCDPRDVSIGADPVNVAPILSDKHQRWYMNLHIFAEEDLERPESHTSNGFDAIAKLVRFRIGSPLEYYLEYPGCDQGRAASWYDEPRVSQPRS
jgi:hypothetical protein